MSTTGLSRGIFPSDLVLKSVIERGIAYLRARPRLVEDIFAPLADDDETQQRYGAAQAREAVDWFSHTDIPVRIHDARQPPTATCVTIQLQGGGQGEGTLADVHYEPAARDDRVWPVLAGPLDPASYDAAAGLLVLPTTSTLVPAEGMVVVDRDGLQAPILGSPAARVATVAAGTRLTAPVTIRGARPARAVTLGSVLEQERFEIGSHIYGEPSALSYLFPILKYVLLRGRVDLERRGMERVSYSTGDVELDASLGPEALWSRFITATLYVRQTWVQTEEDMLYSIAPEDVTAGAVGGLAEDDVPAFGA